jgi:hypothetical protein
VACLDFQGLPFADKVGSKVSRMDWLLRIASTSHANIHSKWQHTAELSERLPDSVSG